MLSHKSKFIQSVISLTIIATTFSPALTFAKENESKNNSAKIKSNFCTRLTNAAQKNEERIADQLGKLDKNRGEREDKTNRRRAEIAAKTAENRSKIDENRAGRYTKMLGKTATDLQKQALATFKATLEQAVAARRTAFDGAQATFKSAMDKVLGDRKTQIDAALSVYKVALKTAQDKAVADCAANVDLKTVKTNLETAIKTAKAQLQASRQTATKVSDKVTALIAARKFTTNQAVSAFKTTMDTAIAVLKAALKPVTAATNTTTQR